GVAAPARASPGLTLPPQAVAARPAARMLRAAFTSRSWAAAHTEQVQARTLSPACPFGPVLAPQAEHCCEDGHHRSMRTTVPSTIGGPSDPGPARTPPAALPATRSACSAPMSSSIANRIVRTPALKAGALPRSQGSRARPRRARPAGGPAGVSLTTPHKQPAPALVDVLERPADQLGAVNTVFVREGRLLGANTDVAGAGWALGRQLGLRDGRWPGTGPGVRL